MLDTELLSEVKLYLRLDGTMEDELIKGMIEAAIEYIKSASGKKYMAGGGLLTESSLVRLAIKMLVAHWYDHRGVEWFGKSDATEIGYSFKIILAHVTTSKEFI